MRKSLIAIGCLLALSTTAVAGDKMEIGRYMVHNDRLGSVSPLVEGICDIYNLSNRNYKLECKIDKDEVRVVYISLSESSTLTTEMFGTTTSYQYRSVYYPPNIGK